MSANFENTTPIKVAEQAERDLNSDAAKKGHGGSDSSKLFHLFASTLTPIPPHPHAYPTFN